MPVLVKCNIGLLIAGGKEITECRRGNSRLWSDADGVARQKMREEKSGIDEFAKFYTQNYDLIYKYAYQMFQNKYIAEDIVQETFCIALRKQNELRDHPNPKWWLLRTARYKIAEVRRRMKYWCMEPLELDRPELAREDARFDIKELEMMALTTVGEKEWQLMKKYYLFGTTISELAEAEGITENNMRVRLSRWTQRLRKGIEH